MITLNLVQCLLNMKQNIKVVILYYSPIKPMFEIYDSPFFSSVKSDFVLMNFPGPSSTTMFSLSSGL